MPGANDQKDQLDADGKPVIPPVVEPSEKEETEEEVAEELDLADAEKVKAQLKKLRDEAAKARIKNKEIVQAKNLSEAKLAALKKALGAEGEDESPEDKVKALQTEKEALETEIAISRISREHDIPKEHDKYFRFLLADKMSALEEGAEIDETDLEEIVAEVKGLAAKKGGGSTGLNSSKTPKPDGNGNALTVEKFAQMTIGEKSSLYAKDPAEYKRLFDAAKEKRLL